MRGQIIHIHTEAPPKPTAGASCNGCGVCCSWRPCPMGVLLSRRTTGPCVALRWFDEVGRYRCAMVDKPSSVLPNLPSWAAAVTARLARRWIAQGIGCDCDLEAAPASRAS
ncbi:MAG: hypothetical protein IPP44_04765 [Ideonella sp.]|nr:hypothetical protein [Ideonella sp.]